MGFSNPNSAGTSAGTTTTVLAPAQGNPERRFLWGQRSNKNNFTHCRSLLDRPPPHAFDTMLRQLLAVTLTLGAALATPVTNPGPPGPADPKRCVPCPQAPRPESNAHPVVFASVLSLTGRSAPAAPRRPILWNSRSQYLMDTYYDSIP